LLLAFKRRKGVGFMEHISSRDNQKIKHALKLKNKKFRYKEKMFFIEGQKMLEEALRRENLLVRIFVEEGREEEYYLMKRPDLEVEEYLLDEKLMRLICDTESPQGMAAVLKMPQWFLPKIIDAGGFFILLDQVSDPGNMGTIIRTVWALEMDGVLLTPGCVDPFNPKVVRASMGGILNLPIFPDIGIKELAHLKAKGYSLLCADLDAEDSFLDHDFTGSKIIVIGNEDRGVDKDIKAACDACFKIPIKPGVNSLNAAVACAIITSEAWKQRHGHSLC